ncbi:DUF4236 domain-containing protein [Clostridium sp.]|uniref:DUF4236 domain-containing protein n=1 Tax=Clostridium sp. TaxID=1506 RepID=UPI0028464B46|nr:DUF4236 domain-containing protein [Clostridium sp.]MDR3598539.1 DUF4236 domain-containing protein [Clostridium sp.]
MGFRMRKSFKIAPGVRVNLGTRSAGISVGGKGFRYSVNSRTGARATVGIPGTGISYTTSGRSYNSAAYSRNRELRRLQREQDKLAELERNKLEVELYENKIDMIKSIHKECNQKIDWIKMERLEPPYNFEIGEKGMNELNAINNLETYKPSFIDKIFRRIDKKIEGLKFGIEMAKKEDEKEYRSWKDMVELARKINSGDVQAYLDVIDEFKSLDDLLEFGSGFEFFIEEPTSLEIDFDVNTDVAVPKESKSLTMNGKVSTKQMTKTAYYDIQKDYVCSCALRIARDMFAILPVNYVTLNALEEKLDTSIGKLAKDVILSVKIDRETLESLNMDLINPSDSMQNFNCNISFKKISGLGKVERIMYE